VSVGLCLLLTNYYKLFSNACVPTLQHRNNVQRNAYFDVVNTDNWQLHQIAVFVHYYNTSEEWHLRVKNENHCLCDSTAFLNFLSCALVLSRFVSLLLIIFNTGVTAIFVCHAYEYNFYNMISVRALLVYSFWKLFAIWGIADCEKLSQPTAIKLWLRSAATLFTLHRHPIFTARQHSLLC